MLFLADINIIVFFNEYEVFCLVVTNKLTDLWTIRMLPIVLSCPFLSKKRDEQGQCWFWDFSKWIQHKRDKQFTTMFISSAVPARHFIKILRSKTESYKEIFFYKNCVNCGFRTRILWIYLIFLIVVRAENLVGVSRGDLLIW